MLISKFMTSQPEKQLIAIHILFNISRNKDSKTMKFGQVIEYNVRNIFLENTFTKCRGETPDSFLKNQYCAYIWIYSLKFIEFIS